MTVYLDANVFLFALWDHNTKGKKSRSLLKKIVKGKENAITCSLTIDEVVWKIMKMTKDRTMAIQQGIRILWMPNIKVIEVGQEDMLRALHLMQKYNNLKPRDAIHASISMAQGIQKIVSDDSDFDEIKKMQRIPLTR